MSVVGTNVVQLLEVFYSSFQLYILLSPYFSPFIYGIFYDKTFICIDPHQK